jgi:hypothetical protein
MTTKSRPNKNYILQVMRDGDMSDPWGNAMAWAFACAENLTVVGEDVPNELGYRPSPFVRRETPETYNPESYEDEIVQSFIAFSTEDDSTIQDRIAEVQFAARCLSRYIDWCKAAGRNY